MRFELVITRHGKRPLTIQGRPVEEDAITMSDARKVIEAEQFLERLLGHRFHINSVFDKEVKKNG